MRLAPLALLPLLTACAEPAATVSGAAGGVTFGETDHAYFGGPYLVISPDELDCLDLAWVQRSYEDGIAPTEGDARLLQFAFATDTVTEGRVGIGIAAAASATVVNVTGGTATFTRAEGGFLDIDAVETETEATGSFEGLAFEDGTLSGSFTATWCRNLRN